MDPDEVEVLRLVPFDLQAKLNSFPDSLQKYIQRFRLGVAPSKRRNRRHVVAGSVTFDYDVELSHETSILQTRYELARGFTMIGRMVRVCSLDAADKALARLPQAAAKRW